MYTYINTSTHIQTPNAYINIHIRVQIRTTLQAHPTPTCTRTKKHTDTPHTPHTSHTRARTHKAHTHTTHKYKNKHNYALGVVYHHIVRFHVTVHDTVGVGIVKSLTERKERKEG